MACTVLRLKAAALHRAQAIRIKSAVEAEETPCIASHAILSSIGPLIIGKVPQNIGK
jgi:hypothetical protein